MSIDVSGGGSLAVTTEALLDAERMLAAMASRAHGARTTAEAAAARTGAAAPPASWAVRLAAHELGQFAHDAARLAAELRAASEVYGWAERTQIAAQALLARSLGPSATVAAAVTALAVASVRAGTLSGDDPWLVAALRGVADSVDVRLLLAAGQALPGAALEETEVEAVRVNHASVAAPPGGFAALAERIPAAEQGAAQVRVERYALPGGAIHWVVYVAGTSDWALTPGADPWDDTSNAVGLAGGSAGSMRATVAALTAAGWKPGEPVLPVGHSQGGIVATALAVSGVASVPMLLTFGSPTAGVAVPSGIVDIAVEHRDDPVPALGGSPRIADRRLVVRGSAPTAAGSGPIPSHSMQGYTQTARQLDESSDRRVAAARVALADFTGGQPAEATLWRGDRVRPAGGG